MYPHYTVPIIFSGLYNYHPMCTLITQSLSFYLVCIITTPMYPHYTVPIILSGLYNYHHHVPSLHSSCHFTYTLAVLSLITIYRPSSPSTILSR